MRKRAKKHIAVLFAGVFAITAVLMRFPGNAFEVKAATEISVASESDLATAFQSTGDVSIILTSDITVSTLYTWNQSYSLTVDLNGHTLTDGGGKGVFQLSSGTLTITDNSSGGGGKIVSSGASVNTINVTGGTLNISGGTITSSQFTALKVASDTSDTKATVTITGGTFTGAYAALKIGSNCDVTISGTPELKGGQGAVWIEGKETNSNLTINGGTYTTDSSEVGYACSVDGSGNSLKITGGTFNMKAAAGSALLIGTNLPDEKVSISGGTFNGRIARMIPSGTAWDYSYYYGNGSSRSGIIASGYVLTDNYFHDSNGQPYVFTADKVDVKPGFLLKLNTNRSKLETYGTDNEANSADYYSLSPVSVGTDGTEIAVYANTNENFTPSIDTSKVTDGNTYTFYGWYDAQGNAVDSVKKYIENSLSGDAGSTACLNAGWTASISTEAGLSSVAEKSSVVKAIEIAGGISLTTGVMAKLGQTTEYKLGSGSWKVSGDDTVYSGGVSFFVTGDEDVEFTKQ